MSDSPSISAEERKRILRERRAAKMAKGNATSRLNTILTQGNSVKDVSSVKSVLDQEPTGATATTTGSVPSKLATPPATASHEVDHDLDPDHHDIEGFINTPGINASNDSVALSNSEDIDEMFKKIFGGQVPGNGTDGAGSEDPLAQMMKMFSQPGAGTGTNTPFSEDPFSAQPEEFKYQQQLVQYNTYRHQVWKFRFLAVRYFALLANFIYHFYIIGDSISFASSSHQFIRELIPVEPARSFFTLFSTIEVVIIASYYFLGTKEGFFSTATSNNFVVKLLDMGSMVLPQLQQFKTIAVRLLGYYELLAVLLGDLSLVVVLFGLHSVLGN
ncbi:hypothetical protein G9P44_000554 [Scheffersomyces stipitis]|nr:hypothetical protein G9P44_000554 [Scheffersomyces stipitis]